MFATVGAAYCQTWQWNELTTNYYTCRLPLSQFDPTTAYDVGVFSDAGNVTLPGLVRYTNAPTLVSIDDCVDRGDMYWQWGLGVQCPVGATITLRGSLFPTGAAVTVQISSSLQPDQYVNLSHPTVVNSSAITATLQPLDDAWSAAYRAGRGSVTVLFTSSTAVTTTNSLQNRLYGALNAPVITSVTSTKCDSVSPLNLTNCRAMATITVAGTNLANYDRLWLATSAGGVFQGYSYLSPQVDTSSTWYDSISNTSLDYTLSYFDADTNVQLQPDVVYTMFIIASSSVVSNAFRLSLTYDTISPATGSSKLSSGAIAGIVIAAVVVALLLLVLVVWLVRHTLSGASLSNKTARDGLQWSIHSDAQGGSEDYKDVELQ